MKREQESKIKKLEREKAKIAQDIEHKLSEYELDLEDRLLKEKAAIEKQEQEKWKSFRRDVELRDADEARDHESILDNVRDTKKSLRKLQKQVDESTTALKRLEKDGS